MVTSVIILSIILLAQIVRFAINNYENKKVINKILKKQKELYYLLALTTPSSIENSTIQDFFTKQLNLLKESIGWMYHGMFRLDEEEQVMPLRFTGYLPEWYMELVGSKVLVKVGDGSIGRSVSTKQPVIVNNVNSDPLFVNVLPIAVRAGYQSVTACPLLGKLKTYGAFTSYSVYSDMFTIVNIQFFMTCANIYSAALEYKLLKQYNVQIA